MKESLFFINYADNVPSGTSERIDDVVDKDATDNKSTAESTEDLGIETELNIKRERVNKPFYTEQVSGKSCRNQDAYLFSNYQQKELSPKINSSRTGRHWTKSWRLLAGTYYELCTHDSDYSLYRVTVNKEGVGRNENISFDEAPTWLQELFEKDYQSYVKWVNSMEPVQ